jgi:SNF2 family DNA or RNA helicase
VSTALTADYTRRHLAMAVPGAFWDADAKSWIVDLDAYPHAAPVVAKLFPELGVVAPAPEPVRPILMSEEVPLDAATMAAVKASVTASLYPYQLKDVTYSVMRMLQDGGGYLAWDMGLGKTLGAIAIAVVLRCRSVAFICNQAAKHPVVRDEFAKWAHTPWAFINVGGSKAARDRALKSFAYNVAQGIPTVAAIHPEALRLVVAQLPKVDLVVFDEAHKLAKGAERGREVPQFYKALKKIRTDYKLCLSGSVIVNSPADVFGALHWLFPKAYRHKWRDWNDRYLRFVDGYRGRLFVDVKRDRLEDLRRELGTVMCVRYKDDVLEGLPPVIERDLYVDLSPVQRRVYDEMAKRFIAELPDDRTIMATSVAVQMIRLRQIASGLDLLGDVVDSTKLDLAQELIAENLPRPTVVFAWHRATVDALVSRLGAAGHRAVGVHGGVHQRDRNAAVTAFNYDPDVVAIVATIKTLGESVSLSNRAPDVVFVESSWSPVDMAQARDRVAGGLRQKGRTGRVNVTRIVARDTVDQHRVLPALLNKQNIRNLVLGGK